VKNLKILMVSPEYPPMHGGVGQYCKSLVGSLEQKGQQVIVVCNEQGNGDIRGLSPHNKNNSDILLKAVENTQPDVVHIQYEQGLYGIHLSPVNPSKTHTGIDHFYIKCKVPIVTTFHSAYNFAQWMNLIVPLSNKRAGSVGAYLRMAFDYWTHLVNYKSFSSLNKRKIAPRRTGIVFSKYLASLIPGTNLIYHGAEPKVINPPPKKEIRREFGIPEDRHIALASGFLTATKGWDIIRKMKIPDGWNIVVNSSRNHYNAERSQRGLGNSRVIELHEGFLSEERLSLLFHSADALLLPYKVSSGSGVMFDGIAHHLPFVSSNIPFFREFSDMGLGIAVERIPSKFSEALVKLEYDFKNYKKAVAEFSKGLKWDLIADKHLMVYDSVTDKCSYEPAIRQSRTQAH
jgi:glycosyltransferase involved in cell wall biosynthesis